MSLVVKAAAIHLVLQALLERGVRWQDGGRDPYTGGLDCYGLVRFAYELAGTTLPDSPEEAEAVFTPIEPPYQAMDVLVCNFGAFHGPRHLVLLTKPPWGFHCS